MSRRLLFALSLVSLSLAVAVPRSEAKQASVSAHLTVTVWPKGQGAHHSYLVVCPRRTKACAALAGLGPRAFAPPPKDLVCTQIYGGPQRAFVSGTLAGHRVSATLRLSDGCQTARWQRLKAVVPIPVS